MGMFWDSETQHLPHPQELIRGSAHAPTPPHSYTGPPGVQLLPFCGWCGWLQLCPTSLSSLPSPL